LHLQFDLVLGLMIHQAYCSIPYQRRFQRGSIVGQAGSCVMTLSDDLPAIMQFETAVAAGKPFGVSSVN
jgi:hypothetical protein